MQHRGNRAFWNTDGFTKVLEGVEVQTDRLEVKNTWPKTWCFSRKTDQFILGSRSFRLKSSCLLDELTAERCEFLIAKVNDMESLNFEKFEKRLLFDGVLQERDPPFSRVKTLFPDGEFTYPLLLKNYVDLVFGWKSAFTYEFANSVGKSFFQYLIGFLTSWTLQYNMFTSAISTNSIGSTQPGSFQIRDDTGIHNRVADFIHYNIEDQCTTIVGEVKQKKDQSNIKQSLEHLVGLWSHNQSLMLGFTSNHLEFRGRIMERYSHDGMLLHTLPPIKLDSNGSLGEIAKLFLAFSLVDCTKITK